MLPQLVLLGVLAADLTGVFSGELSSVSVTLRLTQTGDTVAGTEEIGHRVFPVADGRLTDGRLTFTIALPVAGRLRRLPTVARVVGDEIHVAMGASELALKRVSADAATVRTERLAAAIRLWGAIEFFSPDVMSRPIDWDAALIAAIPRIEAATSQEAYAHALSGMLATLGDSETRLLAPTEPAPVPVACECRAVVRAGFFNNAAGPAAPYYADWESVAERRRYVMTLPEGIRAAIRTAEPVGTGSDPQKRDNSYPNGLPPREHRLLALARYWNTIHYFYGYPECLEAWDSALTEFIPQFEAAQTWRDYVFAVSRLASRTHDGHSAVFSLWTELGVQPNVELRHLFASGPAAGSGPAGEIVVMESRAAALQRGDVILTVDGKPALEREEFLVGLFPNSTSGYGYRAADRYLLAGPEPRVHVGVRRADGKEVTVYLDRDGLVEGERSTPVFGKLPAGPGYIDLARLEVADVDRAFDSILGAPGLILDMRGHGRNVFPLLSARLTDKAVPAVVSSLRVWHGPDPARTTVETLVDYANTGGKPKYRGPIAVLIDAGTFSQGEHTCLYLESAARVIYVGTPTAGNDGEITNVNLPGGIQVNFAGLNVRHANGQPLQRVGIIPDVRVEPSVQGIREGRDEVLERAVQALALAPGY